MQPDERDTREVLTAIAWRLPRYLHLATRLVRDNRLSAWQKAPLVGALGYTVSPIDLVPGFIPVLGQLDDLVLLLSTLRLTLNRIPAHIADEQLMGVGLERTQLEADMADASRLGRALSKRAARGAARLAWNGARLTGRAARSGYRALRDR